MTLEHLEKTFSEHKININNPGFYNDPAFIAAEQADPRFLQNYGFYVLNRTYDDDYLLYVERILPQIAQILFSELKVDGRLGACGDMSTCLMKILELHGIWSVVVTGAFNAVFPDPQITERYFWHFDDPEDIFHQIPGHVWLHCPPYMVVDLTIKLQPYKQMQDKYLTDFVLQKDFNNLTAKFEDLCGPEVCKTVLKSGLTEKKYLNLIRFSHFTQLVPSVTFSISDTVYNYIPFSFTVSDAANLCEMKNLTLSGKTIEDVYQNKIKTIFFSEICSCSDDSLS